MRRLLSVILSVFLSILTFHGQEDKSNTLNIGVISDIHYLSEKLMDNGIAINNYVQNSGKDVIDVPEILDQVIKYYLNSDIDILLIPGDLTKDGEKQSHIDLTKQLKPLIDKGVKIFVVPGNHDINVPNPLGYKGDRTYIVENISQKDFSEIYQDFGYKNTLYQDSTTLSYVTELDPNTWLIALDGCLYNQYIDKTISAGRITDSTLNWIKTVLTIAKENNKQVIGMMHHGLVEHFPMQSIFFKDYLIDDNQSLASLLADSGINIFFTGHFHANDITEFISKKGNKIYDIETGALCAYPFSYRFIKLNRDYIDIETKNITKIKSNPNLVEESKSNLKQLAKKGALSKINNLGFRIDPNLQEKITDIASDIFLQHLAGDEIIDSELKQSIKAISEIIDTDYSQSIEDIQLDFYPADNNLRIELLPSK